MKKDKQMDTIRAALTAYEAAGREYFCSDYVDGEPLTLSAEFQQKVQSIAGDAEKHGKQYLVIHRKARYKPAFLMFILILLMLGTLLACGIYYTIRMSLRDFGLGSEILYDISEQQQELLPDSVEITYEPTWIPEGYTVTERIRNRLAYYVDYENDEGEPLYYLQTLISSSGQIINTEGIEPELLKYNGHDAVYCQNGGVTQLIWIDGQYQYNIFGTALNLNKEAMILIADSLQETNE